MSADTAPFSTAEEKTVTPVRASIDLFLISVLILFLELACIRFFPAHVLFLTFFTNTVLLACFLGMSLGCLAAGRSRNYLTATPALLFLAIVAAHGVERLSSLAAVRVGNQASPQLVFFGTEAVVQDVAHFVIPLEALDAFFFLVIALAMVGPGQVLGAPRPGAQSHSRLHDQHSRQPGGHRPVRALLLVPAFAPGMVPSGRGGPGLLSLRASAELQPCLPLGACSAWSWSVSTSAPAGTSKTGGSPRTSGRLTTASTTNRRRSANISVNLIGHQQMVLRDNNVACGYAYALQYLLHRDAERLAGREPRPFEDVLVIGAGSGNDVSRALHWGRPSCRRRRDRPGHPEPGAGTIRTTRTRTRASVFTSTTVETFCARPTTSTISSSTPWSIPWCCTAATAISVWRAIFSPGRLLTTCAGT